MLKCNNPGASGGAQKARNCWDAKKGIQMDALFAKTKILKLLTILIL